MLAARRKWILLVARERPNARVHPSARALGQHQPDEGHPVHVDALLGLTGYRLVRVRATLF